VELGQVRNGFQQNFLHRVFGILTMTTHPHAEGKNRILEQRQRLLHSGAIPALQKLYGFLNFPAHWLKSTMQIPAPL
jgi:hypothetical protein